MKNGNSKKPHLGRKEPKKKDYAAAFAELLRMERKLTGRQKKGQRALYQKIIIYLQKNT